jgi:hypothetical protein
MTAESSGDRPAELRAFLLSCIESGIFDKNRR